MELRMHGINWYEQGEDLDVIDCYDKEVEVFGEDDAGNEYTATGMDSCGEVVDIDRDSIECLMSFTKECVPKWAKNKKELYEQIDKENK